FLDAASRIETMNLLATLAHDRGKAILLTTHDISRSLLLTDVLWVITKERTVVTGPTQKMVNGSVMDDVFSSQAVRFNPATCDYESR
ncbi:ABC transporter ATP-binding protein, partial [bacterium]|nr:ABC transporter ATP-binding protein [bacterium]